MLHPPDLTNTAWHILNSNWDGADDGLVVPARVTDADAACAIAPTCDAIDIYNTLECGSFGLTITNLDHAVPPGYQDGGVPRGKEFNLNSGERFRISSVPGMPTIPVQCAVTGFDPSDEPLYWRLQCRHVLARHWRAPGTGKWRYSGRVKVLEQEWHGLAWSKDFTLFAAGGDPNVEYTFNDDEADSLVMGGHAILSVAAFPMGSERMLLDYVHLRITGTNPAETEVINYVNERLSDRDANLCAMIRAIFRGESDFQQFKGNAQTSQKWGSAFANVVHGEDAGQGNCRPTFDFPNDPENFPLASFDFGVGIGQYTEINDQRVTAGIAWDWRENIDTCINLFFSEKLKPYQDSTRTILDPSTNQTVTRRLTWREWAWYGWKAYNGVGDAAEAYANGREASSEGQLVSADEIPESVDISPLTLRGADAMSAPPWPPVEMP